MPIGFPAGPAVPIQTLVDGLFDPRNRKYLSPLIQLANLLSSVTMAGSVQMPYLSPAAPGLIPGPAGAAVPPGAVPPPGAVSDRASLLRDVERTTMLAQWWAIWSTGVAAVAGAHPADVNLLRLLRDYIADPANPVPGGGVAPAAGVNSYEMVVPEFAFDGMLGDQLKLRLLGYRRAALYNAVAGAWNQGHVEEFLDLLSLGAHFVVMHAATDIAGTPGPPVSFYDTFGAALGGASRAARAHSHYGGAGPITNINAAYAYPSLVDQEVAPVPCPYIVAFLVGRTAWSLFANPYNTFFQMEGWPTTGWTGVGGRHGADFSTHTATKWNISTYGTSVYSEKRGTTVFLAPPGWAAATVAAPLDPDRVMAPYVGANPRQSWLDTNLVRS